MTKTEELLEKTIALDVLRDQVSEDFYQTLLVAYQRLIRRVSRILSPEFGVELTLSERRIIKKEVAEEIKLYREELTYLAESNLEEFVGTFYGTEKSIANEVKEEDYKDKAGLFTGFLTKYHAIERGKVVQIEALLKAHIALLTSDLEQLINRTGVVVEDEPVVKTYFSQAALKNQNNLNSIALTAVAMAAAHARQMFLKANKKYFRGYQWVSILDGKTSDYCQFRHLKVWYWDDPEKSTLPAEEYPPGHYRCRSGTASIFKGEEAVQTPTYAEWLERQPEELQKEILGVRRFALYKAGKLDLADLHTVSGQRRTISDLKKLF